MIMMEPVEETCIPLLSFNSNLLHLNLPYREVKLQLCFFLLSSVLAPSIFCLFEVDCTELSGISECSSFPNTHAFLYLHHSSF